MKIYNGNALGGDVGNLTEFRVQTLGEGDFISNFATVTDFHRLASKQVETGERLGISSNNGIISTTVSETHNEQSMHTLVFSAPLNTRTIRILTDGSDSSDRPLYLYSIDEIETFGIAVPEPSTYALSLGALSLLSLLFVRITHKRRRS